MWTRIHKPIKISTKSAITKLVFISVRLLYFIFSPTELWAIKELVIIQIMTNHTSCHYTVFKLQKHINLTVLYAIAKCYTAYTYMNTCSVVLHSHRPSFSNTEITSSTFIARSPVHIIWGTVCIKNRRIYMYNSSFTHMVIGKGNPRQTPLTHKGVVKTNALWTSMKIISARF